jgi:hypothetical protein
LKHVGALRNGLAYLSWYNSGWFCHSWYQSYKVFNIQVVRNLDTKFGYLICLLALM